MVQRLAAILSGTVLGGLLCYGFLEMTRELRLFGASGLMIVPIWLFVVQFAVTGVLAGGFTMLFHKLLSREQERKLQQLERALEKLDSTESPPILD